MLANHKQPVQGSLIRKIFGQAKSIFVAKITDLVFAYPTSHYAKHMHFQFFRNWLRQYGTALKGYGKRRPKRHSRVVLIALFVAVVVIFIAALRTTLWPGGSGLSQKTFWDWLELLVIPLSLVIFSFFLQSRQKSQEDKQRDLLRKHEETQQYEQNRRDEEKAKEEVIQIYFDRISSLLIDGELLSIASRAKHGFAEDQRNQLNAAKAIIRARTLSILRRFSDDGERKSSVVRFLIETEVISKIGVRLSHADLAKANLMFADLSGAILNGANMSGTDLSGADLSGADLSHANLSNAKIGNSSLTGSLLFGANLSNAILIGADLSSAHLSGAIFSCSIVDLADFDNAVLKGADLTNANFRLSHITLNQISQALLCNTILPEGMTLDSSRDCEKLAIDSQKVGG